MKTSVGLKYLNFPEDSLRSSSGLVLTPSIMKITKTPVSLTADDKSLIQEISETYCERLGMFKRLFESAADLFNQSFPEDQPGSIEDVIATPYKDGLVFRTPYDADRAHFYAILLDQQTGEWNCHHVDFEKKNECSYYPLEFMPFAVHMAIMHIGH
jgi:hypothetical protein